jgi:hypothetical protein
VTAGTPITDRGSIESDRADRRARAMETVHARSTTAKIFDIL